MEAKPDKCLNIRDCIRFKFTMFVARHKNNAYICMVILLHICNIGSQVISLYLED